MLRKLEKKNEKYIGSGLEACHYERLQMEGGRQKAAEDLESQRAAARAKNLRRKF